MTAKRASGRSQPDPHAELTHLDEAGHARMVDVSAKPETVREATARGRVVMVRETLDRIVEGSVPKGDVLATARRGGFARACVARAAKYAREHGRESVSLTVNKRNTAAIRAYLAMGFSFAGAIVKDIGDGFVMDDYVMRLRV